MKNSGCGGGLAMLGILVVGILMILNPETQGAGLLCIAADFVIFIIFKAIGKE